ncbi:MAG: hypothetical protein AABW79_02630 [Nanoarchaeota archaeon]
MKTNILFLCKYNRFRSRIAEDYFNKINKNPLVKAKSAGIIKGSPIDKLEQKVCKEMKIDISGKTQGISTKLLKWQNLIVIVANDVQVELFNDNKKYSKKTIVWKIPDNKTDKVSEIKGIVNKIKRNVDKLIKELN